MEFEVENIEKKWIIKCTYNLLDNLLKISKCTLKFRKKL